jgi:poly(3-hydroxybutyrate) depolymerase
MSMIERSICAGSVRRTFALETIGKEPRSGRPLVVAFHGAGGTGEQFREQIGIAPPGHAIAWCDGVMRSWNAGPDGLYAFKHGVDDVALFDAVLRSVPHDARRVYVIGFSNGARFAWRLVAERSSVIAGAVACSGDAPDLSARPVRRVPAIYFHGVGDPFVKWSGGIGPQDLECDHNSVEDTIAWSGAALNAFEGGHQWPGGRPIPIPGAGVCPRSPNGSAIAVAAMARWTL